MAGRLPATLGDDHLCAELVELRPEVGSFQANFDAVEEVAAGAAAKFPGKIGQWMEGERGPGKDLTEVSVILDVL